MCCGQGAGCIGRPDVDRLVNADADVYLNVFITQPAPTGPTDTRRAVGVETLRTPGRRFAGTMRREHGPAESLTGLTGTIGAPHSRIPFAADLPHMEPLAPMQPTVVREPAFGDTGIGARCRIS